MSGKQLHERPVRRVEQRQGSHIRADVAKIMLEVTDL